MTVDKVPRATNWNMDDGYSNERNFQASRTYPFRVFGVGHPYITDMVIYGHKSNKLCKDHAQGVRLSLHSPDELPQPSDDFIYISSGHNVYISIKPKMITTLKTLRNYQPEERGCFYRTERELRFFKLYSQKKCELECLTNFTRTKCGCVKFSMPSER